MRGEERIEQLDAMRQGVDYRFPVVVRGFSMMLRPLSMIETVHVAQQVKAHLEERLPHDRTELLAHAFLAKETLIAASTSDVGVKDFRITDHILDRCTPAELSALFKQYVAGCDRCNPSLEKLSQEELADLIGTLKKSQNDPAALGSALSELSLLELGSLAFFLLTKGD